MSSLLPNVFFEKLFSGDVRTVSRAISFVESDEERRRELIEKIFPKTGRAKTIGVTGSPGAGKSTLVDCLAKDLSDRGFKVAILAVDPSSPYTGGAILGDRIRMSQSFEEAGCFIRSMATRGALGGLAPRTSEAIFVLDAAGYDYILVETVGVGQAEVEIVKHVDTVLLVLVPGMGDGVQALKAGIIEIADLFVINKADYDGTSRLRKEITTVLSLAEAGEKEPEILETIATNFTGVKELVETVLAKEASEETKKQLSKRRGAFLLATVRQEVGRQAIKGAFDALSEKELFEFETKLQARELSPIEVAEKLLQNFK